MLSTFDRLRKNSGQATIEYILLLVIVLALVLGPLYQFSKFFSGYIDALFGETGYVACLLETGELGGESTDAGSSCSTAFSAAIKAAQNASANASGSAGLNSGSSSSSANSADSSQPNSSNKQVANPPVAPPAEVSSPNSGTSDGSGSANAGSAFGSSNAANRRNRPTTTSISANANSKDGSGNGDFEKMGEDYDYKKLRPKGSEIALSKLDRRFGLETEEEKLEEKLSPKEIASNNTKNLRNKELTYDPPRAPAAKDDDSSNEFSFSMIVKWLLIAAIIIALVVFIGGQAVQIGKGGDN